MFEGGQRGVQGAQGLIWSFGGAQGLILELWRCTRAHLEHWSAQGLISSFGGAQGLKWELGGVLKEHKEFGRVVVEHIKAFEPCKCSFLVDVSTCSSKVLI